MKIAWHAPPARSKWMCWLAVFLVVAGAALLFHALGIAFCPLSKWVGIPCPACGGTRALAAFLSGHFVEAFHFHPLLMVAGAGSALVFGIALFCGLRFQRIPCPVFSKAERVVLIAALALVILAHWVWMILRACVN